MEQPNITSDGAAILTPRFWAMVAATGIATGLFGDLMMWILFNVQYLAFGYHSGSLQHGIEQASALRRVSSLLIAGAFGGVAWYLLRRHTRGELSELDEPIWNSDGQLSFRRSLGTSLISEVVIGMGASIGREAAPKLLGGASPSVLATWTGLSVPQRRLLVACGGGAGLAAVYNVPLGGALFTAEILCGSISLPIMLPALACAGIATLTAYLYLPVHPTYIGIPAYHFSGSLMVWGAARRPGHRLAVLRVHPPHRVGVLPPRERADSTVRPGDRVRDPRGDRHLVLHRPGTPGSPRPVETEGLGTCHARGDDQPAARRGR